MSTSMALICSEHFSAGVCCKREITSTQGTAPGSCSDRGHHGPVTALGPASLRASLLGVRESMGLGCTGSPPREIWQHPALPALCTLLPSVPPPNPPWLLPAPGSPAVGAGRTGRAGEPSWRQRQLDGLQPQARLRRWS